MQKEVGTAFDQALVKLLFFQVFHPIGRLRSLCVCMGVKAPVLLQVCVDLGHGLDGQTEQLQFL